MADDSPRELDRWVSEADNPGRFGCVCIGIGILGGVLLIGGAAWPNRPGVAVATAWGIWLAALIVEAAVLVVAPRLTWHEYARYDAFATPVGLAERFGIALPDPPSTKANLRRVWSEWHGGWVCLIWPLAMALVVFVGFHSQMVRHDAIGRIVTSLFAGYLFGFFLLLLSIAGFGSSMFGIEFEINRIVLEELDNRHLVDRVEHDQMARLRDHKHKPVRHDAHAEMLRDVNKEQLHAIQEAIDVSLAREGRRGFVLNTVVGAVFFLLGILLGGLLAR